MYKINIQITNRHGELLDKQFSFDTLDEMSNKMGDKMFLLGQEAQDYAKENLMLEEELFDSKEEAEFNKEDLI